jgi:glycolate dehydrogenase FAD-linked subunit
LDDRRVSVGAGAAWGEGPQPQTEAVAEREPIDLGALVGELRAAVGAEHVFTHEHQLRTYESDGLLQYAVTPGAVVLPDSTAEVQAVVGACHAAGVPFVARGAGSGLSGGALPVEDGVLISLSRMRRILEVDLPNQRVVVEPGVTNIAVSQAVAPDHFYPPDPSSQIVCTIGGNVAENSGGAHCFKYGFTTNYVTGLELVLPDGELVLLGGKELDPPGAALLGAFVGSEGTLGVATRIWLRVVPKPETVRTLVAFFGSPVQAGEVVSDIVAGGILPGAIEMMDNLSIRAAEGYANAGYPTDAGAALVVELDGSEAECETRFEQVVSICEGAGADSIRVARDEAERELIWQARKAAFAAMGRIAPNYYVQDSVIPRTRLAEVLGRIDELGREYGLQVANVFHAGDGNLHPLVCYDGSNPGEAERAEECAGMIVKACVEAGGSITGEHGVGVDKKRYMPEMFSDADLGAFQRLRCAFDPEQRSNPGKVMPAPRLCGEVPGPYRRHPLEQAGLAERF